MRTYQFVETDYQKVRRMERRNYIIAKLLVIGMMVAIMAVILYLMVLLADGGPTYS